jgi:hypothetical protein
MTPEPPPMLEQQVQGVCEWCRREQIDMLNPTAKVGVLPNMQASWSYHSYSVCATCYGLFVLFVQWRRDPSSAAGPQLQAGLSPELGETELECP